MAKKPEGWRERRDARDREVFRLREAGWIYRDIGSHFGVTAERARQIYRRAIRHRQWAALLAQATQQPSV